MAVISPRWPGTRSGSIKGVRVWRLPIIPFRPFVMISYVASVFVFTLLRVARFDLVAVHLAYFQADAVVVTARARGRPVWVKVAADGHFGEIARMRRAVPLTPLIGLRWASRVQATSDAIANELKAIGVRDERVARIPNGVDVLRFCPAEPLEARSLRAVANLPQDAVIVLFAGRLAEHKGINDLLRAWALLNLPRTLLLLVGSANTMDKVKLGFETDDILIRPWTPQIDQYYRAADIFVLPSHVEGMSNALLEAMATGLPVIATRVGASESMIDDARNGLLVNTGKPAELATALRRLIADPTLRARLGREARSTILDHFSIGRVVDRLESAYEELM